jgi:hypothetical protein
MASRAIDKKIVKYVAKKLKKRTKQQGEGGG